MRLPPLFVLLVPSERGSVFTDPRSCLSSGPLQLLYCAGVSRGLWLGAILPPAGIFCQPSVLGGCLPPQERSLDPPPTLGGFYPGLWRDFSAPGGGARVPTQSGNQAHYWVASGRGCASAKPYGLPRSLQITQSKSVSSHQAPRPSILLDWAGGVPLGGTSSQAYATDLSDNAPPCLGLAFGSHVPDLQRVPRGGCPAGRDAPPRSARALRPRALLHRAHGLDGRLCHGEVQEGLRERRNSSTPRCHSALWLCKSSAPRPHLSPGSLPPPGQVHSFVNSLEGGLAVDKLRPGGKQYSRSCCVFPPERASETGNMLCPLPAFVFRQYLVQYIRNSAAGLYIWELNFTGTMAWRFLYTTLTLAFVGSKVWAALATVQG